MQYTIDHYPKNYWLAVEDKSVFDPYYKRAAESRLSGKKLEHKETEETEDSQNLPTLLSQFPPVLCIDRGRKAALRFVGG